MVITKIQMGKIMRLLCLGIFMAVWMSGSARAAEPEVPAQAAILMEASTGKVLYEKNADVTRYPASLTKMMTCLIALEEGNLSDPVTISPAAANQEDSPEEIAAGDQISMDMLLSRMMLLSDNAAAYAVAEHISGSAGDFAVKMNRRIGTIGAHNTHFANPNGLPDQTHYSTARDLLRLSAECMKNPKFREIVSQKTRTINWAAASGQPKSELAENTNELLKSYDGITGIKTGWTRAAGGCLAASAKRHNVELIAVVLGAPDMDLRFNAAQQLLDYGFSRIDSKCIMEKSRVEKTLYVRDGKEWWVTAHPAEDIYAPIIDGVQAEGFYWKIEMPLVIKASVAKGAKVGTLILFHDGKEVKQIPMLADEDVDIGNQPISKVIGVIDDVAKAIAG